MSNSPTDNMAIAIAELGSVASELERERELARRRLAVSHGTDAETLAKALKHLDAKIEEARQKLDATKKRAGRVERRAAQPEELRSFRPELESLAAKGEKGARSEELRARALAIRAEVAERNA